MTWQRCQEGIGSLGRRRNCQINAITMLFYGAEAENEAGRRKGGVLGVVVRSGAGQYGQYGVETPHCARSPFLACSRRHNTRQAGHLEKTGILHGFPGEKRSSFFCLYTLGRDLVSILSRARMLHIEHRALGQKRILPGAWLLNSPKCILIEFLTLVPLQSFDT